MKKNGQYVGVDERFIPEEEKYVAGIDSQENLKKTGKKIFKGYLVFFGLIVVMAIVVFVIVLSNIVNARNKQNEHTEQNDEFQNQYNQIYDQIMNNSDGK